MNWTLQKKISKEEEEEEEEEEERRKIKEKWNN